MMLNPIHILAGLALLFAVLAMIWPNYPLTQVAVILLSIAVFMVSK